MAKSIKDDINGAAEKTGRYKHDRLALTLQCVTVGAMIVLAATKAAHIVHELLKRDQRHGRSR